MTIISCFLILWRTNKIIISFDDQERKQLSFSWHAVDNFNSEIKDRKLKTSQILIFLHSESIINALRKISIGNHPEPRKIQSNFPSVQGDFRTNPMANSRPTEDPVSYHGAYMKHQIQNQILFQTFHQRTHRYIGWDQNHQEGRSKRYFSDSHHTSDKWKVPFHLPCSHQLRQIFRPIDGVIVLDFEVGFVKYFQRLPSICLCNAVYDF